MTKPLNTEKKRDEEGRFVLGTGPGPGRPKGKTMKEFARAFLMEMDDTQKKQWLSKLSPDMVWRMAEGNPHQTQETDVTSGGEKIEVPNITNELLEIAKEELKKRLKNGK